MAMINKKTLEKPSAFVTEHPDHFGELLGYKVNKLDRKKGLAKVSLPLKEKHLSLAGRIHGGVVAAFIDFACGAATFTTLQKGESCATVEMKINFLAPLDAGQTLTADARVVFRGKKLAVIQTEVYRKGDKKPVALGLATFHVFVPK